jgi:DNA-binding MarR family transcriptional regulator
MTISSRIRFQVSDRDSPPVWSFLTNHAQVLLCVARDPQMRLREIGDAVGITERAVHRIVVELEAAGYLKRTRNGRRNRYEIARGLPLPDRLARNRKVDELLGVLSEGAPIATETTP